jgi:phosphatidylglycerophosphate synthase
MDTCVDSARDAGRPASMQTLPRRVLATRRTPWAARVAHWLGAMGALPNAVSVAGLGFAAGAGLAFVSAPALMPDRRAIVLTVAAVSIQLRLLCNLLDGMLAIEEGHASPTGEIYNELPDRVADVLILVGAGYALRTLAGGVVMGWAAAVTALLTAYVRVLSGSLGATQRFLGPMAKQHRMFTLTLATGGAAVETLLGGPPRSLYVGLIVIAAGSIVTAIRRTRCLVHEMRAR